MKKIYLKRYIIMSLFLASLSSCTAPVATPTSAVSRTEIPTQTIMNVLATPLVTSIPHLGTSTPLLSLPIEPSITPTYTETRENIPICSGAGEPTMPGDDFSIPGTLIYQHIGYQGLYAIGGTPMTQTQFPFINDQKAYVYGFSPNGEWMAYSLVIDENPDNSPGQVLTGTDVFKTPSITLVSADGEHNEYTINIDGLNYSWNNLYWPSNWLENIVSYPGSYWINDRFIYMSLFYIDPLDQYSSGYYRSIIFDSSNGNWLNDPVDKLSDRFIFQQVGFSPDMTRVLYGAVKNDQVAGIVLRDLENNKVIWSDPEFDYFDGYSIQWSPNNSKVAVTNLSNFPERRHFYLISRDGESTEVIYPDSGTQIYDPSWSPDSRYIAFTAANELIGNYHTLYLYDTLSNHFVYYCPLISFDQLELIIWSPDSAYLAITSYGHYPLQVLNIRTGEITELVQDVYAMGWSDKFPAVWP